MTLNRVIADAVDSLRPAATAKHIDLVLGLDATVEEPLDLDPARPHPSQAGHTEWGIDGGRQGR